MHQEIAALASEHRGWSPIAGENEMTTGRDWSHEYLGNFQKTIGGDTLEIQENIVADRILGLAR